MATMFTATASAIEIDPSDFEFEIEDVLDIEDLIILSGTQVSTDGYCDTPFNELEIEVTNNNDSLRWYSVYLYNGAVEGGESPEFTFSEDFTVADTSISLLSGDSHSYPTYGTYTSVVRVKVTSAVFMGEPTVVFEEDITLCSEQADQELAEAAAEYAAELAAEAAEQALLEAQAAAEAAEQALLEAQEAAEAAEAAAAEEVAEAAAAAAAAAEEAAQAAIDQANAETEAAQAALAQAEAEKELALAQADAVLAQTQSNEEAAESTPDSETSDEELAVGEDLGEHSKSGMSGVVLGLIIVLGLVGVAAITGAVLNLRKQR